MLLLLLLRASQQSRMFIVASSSSLAENEEQSWPSQNLILVFVCSTCSSWSSFLALLYFPSSLGRGEVGRVLTLIVGPFPTATTLQILGVVLWVG